MTYDRIVLMTDFGREDHFAGVLKAVIRAVNPRVEIMDLTHGIEPQNVLQAGFLLKYSWPYFPGRTLFLSVVDPGVGTDRDIILAEKGKQLFLAPDNGLLTFLDEEKGVRYHALRLNSRFFSSRISATFHGRDILAPAAGHISRGVPLREIARPALSVKKLKWPGVRVEKHQLTGTLIYADHFGNLVSNIGKEIFFEFVKLRSSFVISAGREKIREISRTYAEGEHLGALFNSFDLLEIFARSGSARDLLRVSVPSEIRVTVR
jgi:S-adenosylmethionine hydrolase